MHHAVRSHQIGEAKLGVAADRDAVVGADRARYHQLLAESGFELRDSAAAQQSDESRCLGLDGPAPVDELGDVRGAALGSGERGSWDGLAAAAPRGGVRSPGPAVGAVLSEPCAAATGALVVRIEARRVLHAPVCARVRHGSAAGAEKRDDVRDLGRDSAAAAQNCTDVRVRSRAATQKLAEVSGLELAHNDVIP